MKTATHTAPNHPAKKQPSTVWADIDPEARAALHELGVVHPESLNTAQAALYLSQFKGLPTAKSTLEVMRCQGRGPRYRKIGSRVFYAAAALDQYAEGVEVKIFDPCEN